MRNILLLGGTAWLGREITEQLLAAGARVTCVARGNSTPPGATLLRADREHPDALRGVSGRAWDAVIDVSRQPGQVRRAVRDLRESTDRFIFISSGNVYADQARPGQDERSPRLSPLSGDVMPSMDQYGAAKVACEDAVLAAFGPGRSLIARAGLIGGPGDTFGRSGYWPLRFAHPATSANRVLVPRAPRQPTSLIDVRDLAAWLVGATERRLSGIFNATGDVVDFSRHLATAREAAGSTATVVAAEPGWLLARGVQAWAGPRSLPLWLDDAAWHGMNARSNRRARTAGLTLRPLLHTLRDTLAWEEARGPDAARNAGLTCAEEAALLRELLAAGRARG